MSINEAFIKAFRHDAARTAPPAPAMAGSLGARHSAASPAERSEIAWQTTVEFAAAAFSPVVATFATTVAPPTAESPRPIVESPVAESPSTPIIGKRPLSSFPPPQRPTKMPAGSGLLTPETVISAFRWPTICRALWSEYEPQYERVADKLLVAARAGRPLIGITGINPSDGCTTTLLCLAIALAARKVRLALVDANFGDPRLAELLDAHPTTGWCEALERGLPVAEPMIRAADDHIDLLPLRSDRRLAGHDAAALVSGPHTSVTAGVLRSAYDVVLVDLGALLAPGAYAALSHLLRLMPIEAAVVVANPRTADANDAAVVGELLEEDGCELLGVIENRAQP